LGTFNLLWSIFHEWVGIAQDVWRAPWRHKLSYVWRPPGWTHDGSRDTSDMLRAQWLERQAPAAPETSEKSVPNDNSIAVKEKPA
jgi:hypothetical protein